MHSHSILTATQIIYLLQLLFFLSMYDNLIIIKLKLVTKVIF